MKAEILSILILLFVGTFILSPGSAYAETIILQGTLVDNLCAEGHKDDLAALISTHTKTCALMPQCIASGYSIYSNGQLYRFDEESSRKIANFLKNKESSLDVVVKADKSGDGLSLISIENQN